MDLLFILNSSPNARPLVFAHFQELTEFQSTPDTETIADEHIEDERIPPALEEIGQQMGERHFRDFPHHRNRPQDSHVSHQNGLKNRKFKFFVFYEH